MEFYLIMRRYARNSYGTILRFLQSKHNKHNKQTQQQKKSMKRIIIKVMVIDMCVVLCFKIKYTQALGIHKKRGSNRYKSQNSSPFFPLTLLQFSYKNKMALFMCAVCVI